MKFLLFSILILICTLIFLNNDNNFQLKTDFEIKQDSCKDQTQNLAIKNTWGLVKMSEFYNNCLKP